jgi:Putative zinc-finger
MAERTQFPGSAACGQWEILLPDALDGHLTPEEEAQFQEHMAACPACTALYAESRKGREWLEFLAPEPEIPAGLVDRILAKTGPGHAQALPLAGMPMPMPAGGVPIELLTAKWQKPGFMGFVSRFAEPRLMMTGATAFFSIALTMNMLGVRLTSLRLSDLRPTAMRSFMERQLTMASVPIIRYYDHLRFVYEVESRVRELRGNPGSEGQESPSPAQPQGGDSQKNGGGKNGGSGGSRVDPPQQTVPPAAAGPALEASLELIIDAGVSGTDMDWPGTDGTRIDGTGFDETGMDLPGLDGTGMDGTGRIDRSGSEDRLLRVSEGEAQSGSSERSTRERGKPWIA